ncbi:hypothetical protein CDIK_3352 [Cucumispora dikerogammari]|nr:hypothetical protein CDIK_3352 [Cucumispora dikerogammari]
MLMLLTLVNYTILCFDFKKESEKQLQDVLSKRLCEVVKLTEHKHKKLLKNVKAAQQFDYLNYNRPYFALVLLFDQLILEVNQISKEHQIKRSDFNVFLKTFRVLLFCSQGFFHNLDIFLLKRDLKMDMRNPKERQIILNLIKHIVSRPLSIYSSVIYYFIYQFFERFEYLETNKKQKAEKIFASFIERFMSCLYLEFCSPWSNIIKKRVTGLGKEQ